MDSIGIDVHKNESQICILTEDGEVIETRIQTRRERFAAELGKRVKARILIEANTEAEWVARCLEALGHEVVIGHPGYAAMYSTRGRHVKTDRRDAEALAHACRLGNYRAVHRVSEGQRKVRAELVVREALVRTRSRYISVVRSLLRGDGYRVKPGAAKTFDERVAELELSAPIEEVLTPLTSMFSKLNEEIEQRDKALAMRAKEDEVVRRLCTVPGVGPVTAVAFKATLDTAQRFGRAHEVESYLGLVPREYSSGDNQRRGSISKAGNSRMRSLLVEAAWGVLRSEKSSTAPLRAWAERIAVRRGKCIAAVALARKLAGILFAMWRDGTDFKPEPFRSGKQPVAKAA